MPPVEAAYKKMAAHSWLQDWANWLRHDNRINIGGSGIHPLARLMGSSSGGIFREVNEDRAQAVQDVWAHMVSQARNKKLTRFQRRTFALYAFVLKLEYMEGRWTRFEMVSHIAGKYRWPTYNERSLLNHLGASVTYVGQRLGIGS